jgi:ankyrin repeat protein
VHPSRETTMTTSTSDQIQSLLKGINTTSQALQELIETERTEQAATKDELDATKAELVVEEEEHAVTKARLEESETVRVNLEAQNTALAVKVQKLEARRDAIEQCHRAIERGDLRAVRRFYMLHGRTILDLENGWTALHVVCYHGHLEIVRYLMETCHADACAVTSLHLLCACHQLKVAQCFQANDDDTDIGATNENGETPLHCACAQGELQIVQYLVETARVDIHVGNQCGCTALHTACERGRLAVVRYLVETAGADIDATNQRGETPLHVACDSVFGELAIIRYLVESAGLDIYAVDTFGDSSLHLAVRGGKVEVVQFLVEEKGADVEASGADGYNALHLASEKGDLTMMMYLVKHIPYDPWAKAAAPTDEYDQCWGLRCGTPRHWR